MENLENTKQEQIKYLQHLIEDYQQKIKDYEYWKDDYAILKHKSNNIEYINVEKRISRYDIAHINQETMEYIIKREIASLIATELVNSNSITIVMENNGYMDDQIIIRANLEFIKP